MDRFPDDFTGKKLATLQADSQLRQKRPVIVEKTTAAAMAGDHECVIECDDLCHEAKRNLCIELCKRFDFVYASNYKGEWDRVEAFDRASSPISRSYRVVFR